MSIPLQIVSYNENENTCSPSQEELLLRAARRLCEYFEYCTALPTAHMHRDIMVDWLSEGFEEDMLHICIAETARAPRPTWRYLEAIVRHCRTDKAFTADEWNDRDVRWRRGYSSRKEKFNAPLPL